MFNVSCIFAKSDLTATSTQEILLSFQKKVMARYE